MHRLSHIAGWPRAGQEFSPSQGAWFSCRLSGHAVRLNSQTGIEGLPVSSLNCGRPLHPGLVAPELVMRGACRITDEDTSLCGPAV